MFPSVRHQIMFFLTDVEVYHFGWDILATRDIKECKCHFSIFQDIL